VSGELRATLGTRVTDRVKEIAHQQGLSGREIARRLGKSHSWLAGLYAGKQPYDLVDLDEIAAVLNTTAEDLLGIGVYAAAPEFLPPEVQRTVDHFAQSLMARWNQPGVTPGQQRALLRVVNKAWEYVEKGMVFWQNGLADTRKPVPRKRGGSTP